MPQSFSELLIVVNHFFWGLDFVYCVLIFDIDLKSSTDRGICCLFCIGYWGMSLPADMIMSSSDSYSTSRSSLFLSSLLPPFLSSYRLSGDLILTFRVSFFFGELSDLRALLLEIEPLLGSLMFFFFFYSSLPSWDLTVLLSSSLFLSLFLSLVFLVKLFDRTTSFYVFDLLISFFSFPLF